MNDLRRWLEDEPPAEVRRLLEVGQFERPASVVLDRVLDQVRVTQPGGTESQLPGAPGNLVRVGGRLLLGAMLLGATGVTLHSLGQPQDSTAPLESGLAQYAPPSPPARQVLEPAASSDSAKADAVAAEVPAPVAKAVAMGTKPKTRPAPAAVKSSRGRVCEPGVPEQIQLLEQAKRELSSGSGAQALKSLDRYDRFGTGRCFVPESLKIRMDAYRQTGNLDAARRVAGTIEKHYPRTAQARAAETLLQR